MFVLINQFCPMKRYVVVLLFLGICNLASAQIAGLDDDGLFFKTRVKLVEEFFDRFNGEKNNPLIEFGDVESRKKNLCMLFNYDYIRTNKERLARESVAFADSVISSGVRINYEDVNWFAKATCVGTMNGEPKDFTLYLTVENRRDDLYKWVITRAEGEIFNLSPPLLSDKIMLMPDEHEMHFMGLHRITVQEDGYITSYAQKDFCVDETSVFYALVYNGLLDIDHVKDVELIFLQVPGYSFSIKEIENETSNAGWLIDNLRKMSEKEKDEVLDYVYRGLLVKNEIEEPDTSFKLLDVDTLRIDTLSESSKDRVNSPVEVVMDFAEELSLWALTNDSIHLEGLRNLYNAGDSSGMSCISDLISKNLAKKNRIAKAKSYAIDLFMEWLQKEIDKGLAIKVFDIRDVSQEVIAKRQAQDGKSYVIAQIGMAGAVNYHVTDLFCIQNGKIARIENYKGSIRK